MKRMKNMRKQAMKKHCIPLLTASLFYLMFAAAACSADYRLTETGSKDTTPLEKAVSELKENRLVLVGELHDNRTHHEKQLAVIKALHEAGAQVAIGLEMFRHDSQEALNKWVSGQMAPEEFIPIYYDNWNFPWPLYSMIFDYARENKIPMVGLNVGRDITRQVAREGFTSLSEEQRGKLEDVTCRVDEDYMNFIRGVFGDKSHGHLNFNYFCEAQLVWDNVMAVYALEYLKNHPRSTMVLLTGNGHARKRGIPTQVEKRSNLPQAVILPMTPGYITPENVGTDEADYLISH